MKRFIMLFLAVIIFTSVSFGQEQVRHRSGPRRQLATIVFAGLGGAILGLSTLSFYGRPQDQLSNIAIGFAVGIIVGTVVVTFKSATSREYYDEKPTNQQGHLLLPKDATLVTEGGSDLEETHWSWGAMVTKVQQAPSSNINAYGGQVQFQF